MNLELNLKRTRERLKKAAESSGRDKKDITLIAVTKTFPASIINEAISAGVTDIGENRIQETEAKYPDVLSGVTWHLVGHLQKNKAKKAVKIFDVIHSVDNVELAAEINKRSHREIDIFVQVNIGEEAQKSGVMPENVLGFVSGLKDFDNLRCRGLMVIPPFGDDPEQSRKYFKETARIQNEINEKELTPEPLTDLSMGMTNDFEIAIEEGATVVRVGRAIFGERTPFQQVSKV